MNVTVFTKPGCVQCDWTKKLLDEMDVPYVARDVSMDAGARQMLLSEGHSSAPVVKVNDVAKPDTWVGFKPDRIRAIPGLA